jgi:NADH-quinone oxidoreductase subunit N
VPDAYVGAPIRVAAFLSVVSKSGGFAGLLVVLWFGLRPYGESWGTVLAIIAALTMTIGNLGALRQTDVVRLLAWSSIAQSGFMLVPLAAAGIATTSRGIGLDGAAATIAYLAVYAVMNLGAFAVVAGTDARRAGGARTVADYTGIVRTNPLAGLGLAFFLVSLAGLPPGVAGLVTKVVVLRSAVDAGLGWLAVVMAVNVVIGLAYYLRWTAVIFARPEATAPYQGRLDVNVHGRAPLVTVGVALAVAIALSVWPQAVLAVL